MNTPESQTIWITIFTLAIGTYLLRFSFLGLIGDRTLPLWLKRLLRYVPVAVLPAMVAPMVAWPSATGGETDPARLSAALVTLLIAAISRSLLAAIIGGMTTLYVLQYILS
jgi:branched-subunit amino acid transport protein